MWQLSCKIALDRRTHPVLVERGFCVLVLTARNGHSVGTTPTYTLLERDGILEDVERTWTLCVAVVMHVAAAEDKGETTQKIKLLFKRTLAVTLVSRADFKCDPTTDVFIEN